MQGGALEAGALQQEAQLQHQQLLKGQAAPRLLGFLDAAGHMPAPHRLCRIIAHAQTRHHTSREASSWTAFSHSLLNRCTACMHESEDANCRQATKVEALCKCAGSLDHLQGGHYTWRQGIRLC